MSHAFMLGANLRGADIYLAYFNLACINEAKLQGARIYNGETILDDTSIFQVGPIGSRGDVLVAYNTSAGVRIDVGCQRQITVERFLSRLHSKHHNTPFEKEYLAALELIKARFRLETL